MFAAPVLASLLLASNAISSTEASKLSRVIRDAQKRRDFTPFDIPFNSGVLPNTKTIGTGPGRMKQDSRSHRRSYVGSGTDDGDAEGLIRRYVVRCVHWAIRFHCFQSSCRVYRLRDCNCTGRAQLLALLCLRARAQPRQMTTSLSKT